MKRDRTALPAFQRGFVRFVLAFVTCFVACGYFASLTHMAFVAHTACAEHGMLVHVQGGAALAQDTPSGDASARADGSDAVVSDEHEHCAAGTMQPNRAPDAGAARAVTLFEDPPARAEPARPPRLEARAPLPPPIPLLLLSPKSSPPA